MTEEGDGAEKVKSEASSSPEQECTVAEAPAQAPVQNGGSESSPRGLSDPPAAGSQSLAAAAAAAGAAAAADGPEAENAKAPAAQETPETSAEVPPEVNAAETGIDPTLPAEEEEAAVQAQAEKQTGAAAEEASVVDAEAERQLAEEPATSTEPPEKAVSEIADPPVSLQPGPTQGPAEGSPAELPLAPVTAEEPGEPQASASSTVPEVVTDVAPVAAEEPGEPQASASSTVPEVVTDIGSALAEPEAAEAEAAALAVEATAETVLGEPRATEVPAVSPENGEQQPSVHGNHAAGGEPVAAEAVATPPVAPPSAVLRPPPAQEEAAEEEEEGVGQGATETAEVAGLPEVAEVLGSGGEEAAQVQQPTADAETENEIHRAEAEAPVQEAAPQGEAAGEGVVGSPAGLEVLGAPVLRLPPGLAAPDAKGKAASIAAAPAPESEQPKLEVPEVVEPEPEHWQDEEGRSCVEVTVTTEEARSLLQDPAVQSSMTGKAVTSARQRIALMVGALILLDAPGEGEQTLVRVTIKSDCQKKTLRALKYIRLVCRSNQWWVRVTAADDDEDLTVLEVPDSTLAYVIGRQACSLLSVCEDNSVMAFVVDDSPPAAPPAPAAVVDVPTGPKRPPVPWMAVGMRVEVKRSGDIRRGCWLAGHVEEQLRFGTARVRLESGSVCTADLSNMRPSFEVGEKIQVRSEAEADWSRGVTVEEQLEEGRYRLRLPDGQLREAGWQELRREAEEEQEEEAPDDKGEQGQIQEVGKEPTLEENERAAQVPKNDGKPSEASEPKARIALFGDLRNRCAAQLSFMRAADKKRPDFYSKGIGTGPQDWGAPAGADWGLTLLDLEQEILPKCIGTKGAMRRKLGTVSEVALEYLGTKAYICGPERNRAFAAALLRILCASERGDVREPQTRDAMDFCRALPIPGDMVASVMGTSRSSLNRIEEEEGVITFLQAVEPEAPQDQSSQSGEQQTTPRGAETDTTGEVEGDAGGEAEQKGNEVGVVEASQPGLPSRQVLIFALSERCRALAGLRVLSMIESRRPGEISHGLPECTREDEAGLGTEIVEMEPEQIARLIGKQGSMRRKLQAASGCGIEFIGTRAVFVGVRVERERARQYAQWVVAGSAHKSLELPSSIEERSDVKVVEVTRDRASLSSEALAGIEQSSGTLIFFREPPLTEVLAPGHTVRLQRGSRTVIARIEEAEQGRLSLVLQEAEEVEEGERPRLLIFSHDSGPSGFTGREHAAELLRELLEPGREAAVSSSKEAAAGVDGAAAAASAMSALPAKVGAWPRRWREEEEVWQSASREVGRSGRDEESWQREDVDWQGGRGRSWGAPLGGRPEEENPRHVARKASRGPRNQRGTQAGAAGAPSVLEEDWHGHGLSKRQQPQQPWGSNSVSMASNPIGGEVWPSTGSTSTGRPKTSAAATNEDNPWGNWDASKLRQEQRGDPRRDDLRQGQARDAWQHEDPAAQSAWGNWDASKVSMDSKADDNWHRRERGGDWNSGQRGSGWGRWKG